MVCEHCRLSEDELSRLRSELIDSQTARRTAEDQLRALRAYVGRSRLEQSPQKTGSQASVPLGSSLSVSERNALESTKQEVSSPSQSIDILLV